MDNKKENLKYTFNQVNDWIKTADQKALILGSFNIAGLIYQLVSLDKVKCGNFVLFALSILATFFALFFWIRIIYPRLDNKHKKSKIYFEHIANAYEDDRDSGIEELKNFSDEEFQRDLASQIVINSIIAKRKYKNIRYFIFAFGIQLLFIFLFFISYF